MAKKETIVPPTKRETSQASNLLRQGSSVGGRVMADRSVAVRQGAARPSAPKKR